MFAWPLLAALLLPVFLLAAASTADSKVRDHRFDAVHYNLGSISIDALLDSRPIDNVTAVQYRWAAGHSTTGRQCTILTGSRFLDARRHEENCGRQGRVCQNRLGPHLFCQINFINTWIAFFSSSYYFRN
ncbi:hypothetical protein BDA96_09G150100 [Sorghum bicolor]|uniref:SCP domain-containing protein n=1 Tax=Sorghum bicolor TaxID=4558 RepID=A0A921QD30_SORBI|nr:hypothetical protein BDA96_09G150100 [Sorghum bicolor]